MMELFVKGGPLMWPLLVTSIVALTVVIERLFFIVRDRVRRKPGAVHEILERVEKGDYAGAVQTGEGSRDFVARVLSYALTHREKSVSDALLRAAGREPKRYNRGLSILDTVITLAPLLGLLGTVTGMIHSFGLLGGQEIEAPQAIAGGIAEALIATACGLAVAILALLPFNYLNAQLEGARNDIQDAASHLELQLARGRTTARVEAAQLAQMTIPSPRSARKARIEIIPLIDIIFFLLATLVMVSLSMIKNRGIPVNLPTASSATPQDRSDYTAITVTAEGDLYFNKDAMSLQEVVEPLRALKMTTTDPLVFIHGDAKAEFGTAIAVLDEVRKLGIAKVAIGTKSR